MKALRSTNSSPTTRRCTEIQCTAELLERRVMLSNVIPVGAEFRANTYTTNHQIDPSMAMDAAGNFVIAWESNGQDGSDAGIYAQRYSAAGIAQGAEFRVNTYTTSYQFRPTVAVAKRGDFVIAWAGAIQDGSGLGIFAQRYDSTGANAGSEFRVNSVTVSDQTTPAIAIDEDGAFVVAWSSDLHDGSDWGIFARRYNSLAVPQGDDFRVNTYTTNRQAQPAVAMTAHGGFVVAWSSDGQDGSEDGIYAQRYDSSGVPLGSEFQVNTYTTGDQRAPTVSVDENGAFVIAWESNGQDGSGFGIYAQRYSAAGFPNGPEFHVNSDTIGQQRFPSVALDANGDFVVAWGSDFGDISGYEVFARRVTAAAVPQGEEFRVNTYTTFNQQLPAVAVNAAGDFAIVWQSPQQDGHLFGIFGRRYAVVPEVTSSSFLFDSAPHRLRFRFNHDVRDSLATEDLLVQNLTTGKIIPSDQFALLYDRLSDVATFIYLGSGNGAIAGVLPDGRYRATLRADGIVTPQGASPATDHEFEFFFLNGDPNRDGRVNLGDFNILAHHFGQTGTDFTRGDFTYDGATDLEDFNLLAVRFGLGLPDAAPRSFGGEDPLEEETMIMELLL